MATIHGQNLYLTLPHRREASSYHPCCSSFFFKYILIQNQLETARFKTQLLSSAHPWKEKNNPPGIPPWILLASNLKPQNDNYLFLILYRLNLKCFWILIIRDCQKQGCGKSHTVIFPFLMFPDVSISKSATYAWERLSILFLLTHISVYFLSFFSPKRTAAKRIDNPENKEWLYWIPGEKDMEKRTTAYLKKTHYCPLGKNLGVHIKAIFICRTFLTKICNIKYYKGCHKKSNTKETFPGIFSTIVERTRAEPLTKQSVWG